MHRPGRPILTFALVGLCLFLFWGCKKEEQEVPVPEIQIIDVEEYNRVVEALNACVDGLFQLVDAWSEGKTITMFSPQHHSDGTVTYLFQMDDESQFAVLGTICSASCPLPLVSFIESGGQYYWTLNGECVLLDNGDRVNVLDGNHQPRFYYSDGCIEYSLGADSEKINISDSNDKQVSIIKADFDTENKLAVLSLSSGSSLRIPIYGASSLLVKNVKNEAYYKDVFLDAGAGLTSRKTLPAAHALRLSLEGISFARNADVPEEIVLQHDIIAGSDDDENGRLLYPDGQPRYRLLFVNGGSSTTHGKTLGEDGKARMQQFVANGGSYVGTCAGAFFASSGCDSHDGYLYYLHLWPGIMGHTGISNGSTDMTIEKDSPLLDYYSFGGDYYVEDIRHNGGGFPLSLPECTEVLARYHCPDISNVHQKPSIWSYKTSSSAGRVIMEGSHPEEVSQGERLDLTSAMMLYAMDGCGEVSIKGFLKNGESRVMDKPSSDNQPEFARIGDLQCHHFAVFIPRDSKDITFNLHGTPNSCFRLMICNDNYAFESNADYIEYTDNGELEVIFPNLDEGVWYVALQCMTTVTVKETDYGQEYEGNVEVLNGIPYSISVSWNN